MRTYQLLLSDGLTQFAAADEYRIVDGQLVFCVAGAAVASYVNAQVVSLNDLGPALVSDDPFPAPRHTPFEAPAPVHAHGQVHSGKSSSQGISP